MGSYLTRFWEPDGHGMNKAERMAEAGVNPELAHAIQAHNSDLNSRLPKPEHVMEKYLYACDELSGLIQASVRMRPSGSVRDFDVRSLKKKFKNKKFAAGCDRDVIRRGAEYLGIELDELFAITIEAMQAIAPVGDTYANQAE